MEMIKICVLALMGVLLAVSVRSCRPEYGIYMAAVICLVLAGAVLTCFTEITSIIERLQKYYPDQEGYLALLLKAVGAAYACELCSGICRDAGYGGIAGEVEMIGKLYILWTGMPVLFALLECIQGLTVG